MTNNWHTSTRRGRLPSDWPRRRLVVLGRDGHECRYRLEGICTLVATEVDHVINNDNDDLSNLVATCAPCHRKKTQAEALAARPSQHRPRERHPGQPR